MRVIDPGTGKLLRNVAEHDPAEVERRVERAGRAFGVWRRTSFEERAAHLRAAAAELRRELGAHARLISQEMGKPILQSEAEIEKCASTCEHFAEHAVLYLAAESVATEATESYVRCDPLGAILAIMPWNFPFWQVIRAAAPALMAGNVVLLKHASNVPGAAVAIERLLAAAGFPEGVFTTLLISSEAAEALIEHPSIAAVTLTGSDAAGMAIASRAGRVLKKVVLELGGSDAFVVLADVDPVEVARRATAARTIANGQSCIAAKRFIVEEAVAEPFERAFAETMGALRVGDPLQRTTELGPLAREDLVTTLDGQVQRSIEQGARLLTGGARLERPGYYYAPTVLTNVRPGMPAFDEETFGPVAAVVRARNATHAVELANRSAYGLGASVWTADAARGEALAAELEAGSVFVNEMVRSDPRLPFGGIKRSGYGRELAGHGIREFVNLKTVWVK